MNSHRVAEDAAAADPSDLAWEGVVRGLSATDENGRRVLRFVLECDGRSLPVEMRGEELRGVLSEGDRVQLADAPMRSGTVLAAYLINLSTNARVEMWRPSKQVRLVRLGAALGKTIVSTVVTTLVGVVIGAIFVKGFGAPGAGGRVGQGQTGTHTRQVVAVIVGVCVLALLAVFIWRRRRSRKSVAVLIGASIGVLLAVLLVASSS
jgi:LPXTG-motif cell wall-anchored protein